MRITKLLILLSLASLQWTFPAAANGPKHPDAKRRGGSSTTPDKPGRWSGERKRENPTRPPERGRVESKSTTREERRPGAGGKTREKSSAWDRSLQKVESRRTTDGKSPESKFAERERRANAARNVDKAGKWSRSYREKKLGAMSERRQFLEHLFRGEVKDGKATGFHYEGARMEAANGTRVIESTRTAPDARGVYRAKVQVMGVTKKARSTFFPRSWSRGEVLKAVKEAQGDMRRVDPENRPNYYEGRTSSGMTIGMYCNIHKQPVTAFPIYGK